MLYFIPWVLFLLVVILAVPVAAFLEKRKRIAEMGPMDTEPSMEEEAEGEVAAEEEQVESIDGDGFGEDPTAEFTDVEGAAVDDFSAFEDEFK